MIEIQIVSISINIKKFFTKRQKCNVIMQKTQNLKFVKKLVSSCLLLWIEIFTTQHLWDHFTKNSKDAVTHGVWLKHIAKLAIHDMSILKLGSWDT